MPRTRQKPAISANAADQAAQTVPKHNTLQPADHETFFAGLEVHQTTHVYLAYLQKYNYIMLMVDPRFSWNVAKAASNLKKHGVSFEVAARVFFDPFALTEQDRIEGGERRWQTLGLVEGHLLLLVAHTVIEDDAGGELIDVIHIISARRADRTERRRYEDEGC